MLPYIPFLNYRERWVNEKLYKIKLKRNDEMFRDNDGCDIDWSVVKYTLCMYYNDKYFNSTDITIGLRLSPYQLMPYLEN